MIEFVEVEVRIKEPISVESFCRYLRENGWLEDANPNFKLWRHESGKAPLLNLSENHLSTSIKALSDYENRSIFEIWLDILFLTRS